MESRPTFLLYKKVAFYKPTFLYNKKVEHKVNICNQKLYILDYQELPSFMQRKTCERHFV
jgi:hypothetical protein